MIPFNLIRIGGYVLVVAIIFIMGFRVGKDSVEAKQNRQAQQDLQAANDRTLQADNKRKHNDEINAQTVKDYQLNLAVLKELNDKLQTEKSNPRIRTIYIKDKSGNTVCSGDGYVDPEFARLWNVRLAGEQAGGTGSLPITPASITVTTPKATSVRLK